MVTVTKKEVIDRIADKSLYQRTVVKQVIQNFFDELIDELSQGNRIEFRDFGVFETKLRAARTAQNPKTLERVAVKSRRRVKFKLGRVLKLRLKSPPSA